jgi:serine/threonine protein kinase
METKVIELQSSGTQILTEGSTTETSSNFTGGLLQIHEWVSGWEVTGKLGMLSGEADIYIAQREGQKGIIKYYRSVTSPKTEILKKIKGLDHPDIVRLYDFGLYNDRFYEIMEYAEGGALDTRNTDGSYRYLPLSEETVEGVCKEVINSFKTCHELNIIHRDIKPANIYFRTVEIEEIEGGGEGEEKKTVYRGNDAIIADFGISSIMDDAEQLHKTRTGSRTTGYAAPEVLSGIISPKMDYYALGITLWELLTGKDPFTLDNGKRRNDAHLIRDTIEGRIADDILSKEPRLSQKMERLIRGLLVLDPQRRWGYDEVTRHLAGETVDFYQEAKKAWSFSIGDVECSTLEALGSAIIENPEASKKYVFRGLLGAKLEKYYPDISKQIVQIAEEASAANDQDNGIIKIAFLLNPGLPLKMANGFKIQNLDDLIFILENAPESAVPLLKNAKSKLYTWLDIMGYKDIAQEIRDLPDFSGMGSTELAGKAEVLLKNKVIKPFKLAKYADFELSTLDQIRKVPKDMQTRILTLVKEKSYEGLFLPWFELLAPKTGSSGLLTEYFGLTSSVNSASSKGGSPPIQTNAQISTYSPCEIDSAQSKIKERQYGGLRYNENNSSYSSYTIELSVKIAGTIPDDAAEFWYFVRTRSSTDHPWVEAKEIASARDINKITVDDYKKKGEILFSKNVKDEYAFYFTMFTVYEINGKKTVSLPSKCRFVRALNANVYWKVAKPIIGNKRLSIEITANRSLIRLPRFVLCANHDGEHLKNYTDKNSKILMEIQGEELSTPQAFFKKEYEITSPESFKLTKNSKLFLFIISPASNEGYSSRWADGFSGKI